MKVTCARGCCFTGLSVCARAYSCKCHWASQRPTRTPGGADRTYRDPTANQAIGNVMKQKGQK
jgi:hypothetical protein